MQRILRCFTAKVSHRGRQRQVVSWGPAPLGESSIKPNGASQKVPENSVYDKESEFWGTWKLNAYAAQNAGEMSLSLSPAQ